MGSRMLLLLSLVVALAASLPLQAADNLVDRTKRAEEEIVFGNQQNTARMGAAKKSAPEALTDAQADAQTDVNTLINSVSDTKSESAPAESAAEIFEKVAEPEEVVVVKDTETAPVESDLASSSSSAASASAAAAALPASSAAATTAAVAALQDGVDSTGVVFAQPQQPEGSNEEKDTADAPVMEGGDAAPPAPLAPLATFAVPAPEVEAVLPISSQAADAEEGLVGAEQEDEVESFLKTLHEDQEKAESEGDAEAELLQVADKAQESANENKGDTALSTNQSSAQELGADSNDYATNFLNYILSQYSGYGRPSSMYPSYYTLRRRRSPYRPYRPAPFAPRARRFRRNGQRLRRAKRTKRDLVDPYWAFKQAELVAEEEAMEEEAREEEEARKLEDLKRLVTYLTRLYPQRFSTDAPAPPRPPPVPQQGYVWFDSGASAPGSLQDPRGAYQFLDEPDFLDEEDEEDVPEYVDEDELYAQQPEELAPAYYAPRASKRASYAYPGFPAPEMRRKRYFYPVYQEPYTHWGAFVPSAQKRDYDDAYWRLKKLAFALAESPYTQEYPEYKKK